MPDNRFGTLTWDQRRHISNALRLWGRELADARRTDELVTVNQLIAELNPPIKYTEASR